MMILLKNVHVLNPLINLMGENVDILIDDSKIKAIGENIVNNDALIINAGNKIAVPGLVDVHVHFRQPGQEHKETIYTGSRAAAAGGFTSVVTEPNTSPPIDTVSRIKELLKIAENQSIVKFYTKACITEHSKGERLTRIRDLKDAGAAAVSDDGNPVPDEDLMGKALEESARCGILVSPHCEESEFYRQKMSQRNLPVSPIPYNSEVEFVRRDIALAEKAGARIHISHVSLAESVKEIAGAKKRGVAVTAEAAPQHFILTEKDAKEIGTNAKVNPPLRSAEDVAAIKSGLADGTIDIIATDHAPHSPQEKAVPWEQAPFGLIGLETSLGLVLTYLVQPGILTLSQAIAKMSTIPAKIFGLPVHEIAEGQPADLTLIDLEQKWTVDADKFYSKGRNCPFNGWQLQGKAFMTIVNGRIVMQDGRIIPPPLLKGGRGGLLFPNI